MLAPFQVFRARARGKPRDPVWPSSGNSYKSHHVEHAAQLPAMGNIYSSRRDDSQMARWLSALAVWLFGREAATVQWASRLRARSPREGAPPLACATRQKGVPLWGLPGAGARRLSARAARPVKLLWSKAANKKRRASMSGPRQFLAPRVEGVGMRWYLSTYLLLFSCWKKVARLSTRRCLGTTRSLLMRSIGRGRSASQRGT